MVKFTYCDTNVAMVQDLIPVAVLAKRAIKFTFRLLPTDSDDFDLQRFAFKDVFYYDNAPLMGTSFCVLYLNILASFE